MIRRSPRIPLEALPEAESHNYKALCVREFSDGTVCRERLMLLETRLVRDEDGRAVQERVGECPRCGLVLQAISHEGLTAKRYVVRRQRPRRRIRARTGTARA